MGHASSGPEAAGGAPASQAPTRPGTSTLVVVAVILALLVLTGAHLRNELRFFAPGALIGADGGAPVLQGDPNAPTVDAAFRAAAAHLPASATCVIGRDAWNRNYFRAAYLLMPRRVWPAAALPAGGPVTSDEPVSARVLARAVRAHHATCILVTADERVPPGFLLITRGTYSLYTLIHSPHPSRFIQMAAPVRKP